MSDYRHMDNWTSKEVEEFKYNSKYPEETLMVSTVDSNKQIISEGDSWFDYLPGTDLIDCLRKLFGYKIDNFAKHGDTLENMIYGTGITDKYERTIPTINRVLRQLGKVKPKVFLFSGGGNDVAGDEFESYLNHKESNVEILRESYLDYNIY